MVVVLLSSLYTVTSERNRMGTAATQHISSKSHGTKWNETNTNAWVEMSWMHSVYGSVDDDVRFVFIFGMRKTNAYTMLVIDSAINSYWIVCDERRIRLAFIFGN